MDISKIIKGEYDVEAAIKAEATHKKAIASARKDSRQLMNVSIKKATFLETLDKRAENLDDRRKSAERAVKKMEDILTNILIGYTHAKKNKKPLDHSTQININSMKAVLQSYQSSPVEGLQSTLAFELNAIAKRKKKDLALLETFKKGLSKSEYDKRSLLIDLHYNCDITKLKRVELIADYLNNSLSDVKETELQLEESK